MGYKLGNKEAILNNSSKFSYSLVGDVMTLKGLGSFKQANLLTAFGQRYIAPTNGGLIITAPTAAQLGIAASAVNTPVKAHIRINTTRHTSEWATDFIKRGRPFIFELLVSDGFTSAQVGDLLADAFDQYEAKFNYSELPFTWTNDGAGKITIKLKDPYLSIQKTVEFLPDKAVYGVKATTTSYLPYPTAVTVTGVNNLAATTLNVSSSAEMRVGHKILLDGIDGSYTITGITDATTITITPGLEEATAGGEAITVDTQPQEPTFDGKYLEENVRMSTMYTSDSYGISPDEKPVISGGYTAITFTVKSEDGNGIDGNYAPHKNLGITADETTGTAVHTFTIYVLEGSDVFSGGTLQSIVSFLIGGTPAIDTFLLANGEAAADAAGFVA